jgi:hypothetical protein
MRRHRVAVARGPVPGEAHEDGTPVVGTHAATHQPVLLEPSDRSREGALAEVDVLGQVGHPVVAAVGVDEPVEDLELTEPDAVIVLQGLLECAAHLGVAIEQLPPLTDLRPGRGTLRAHGGGRRGHGVQNTGPRGSMQAH